MNGDSGKTGGMRIPLNEGVHSRGGGGSENNKKDLPGLRKKSLPMAKGGKQDKSLEENNINRSRRAEVLPSKRISEKMVLKLS